MVKNTVFYVKLHTPCWAEKYYVAHIFFTITYLGTSSINHQSLKAFPCQIVFMSLSGFNHVITFSNKIVYNIQEIPDLNVLTLSSCRGLQIKKSSVKFVCKFAIFLHIYLQYILNFFKY